MAPKKSFQFVLILYLLPTVASIANDINFDKRLITLSGNEYAVEIARSTKERRRGLMYRDRLDKRHGMLFIYQRVGYHRIWMKNTLIPLTVIWFDETKTAIDIKKLIPCTTDVCPNFGVSKPSKYVLELNGEYHGLTPGMKFEGPNQLE